MFDSASTRYVSLYFPMLWDWVGRGADRRQLLSVHITTMAAEFSFITNTPSRTIMDDRLGYGRAWIRVCDSGRRSRWSMIACMTCGSCTDARSQSLAVVARKSQTICGRKYSTQTVSDKFWLLIVVYQHVLNFPKE